METTFENKCAILATMWMEYRDDEAFEEFIEYNDLGLPMAYIVDADLMQPGTVAKEMINETFAMLLDILEVEEDTGFESLYDIIGD